MIVYIAGGITEIFGFKMNFGKAEKYLKSMGHIVINPADLPQGLRDYMPICKALIDQADGVYFLNDWQQSQGACEEYSYSVEKGKHIIYESVWKQSKHNQIKFWRNEAIKATAELGEIKIRITEATKKVGISYD